MHADDPDHIDIPELDDIVEQPATEEKPLPNLDLFANDTAALAEARDSVEAAIRAGLQQDFAALDDEFSRRLQELLERWLNETLPQILDDAFRRRDQQPPTV